MFRKFEKLSLPATREKRGTTESKKKRIFGSPEGEIAPSAGIFSYETFFNPECMRRFTILPYDGSTYRGPEKNI